MTKLLAAATAVVLVLAVVAVWVLGLDDDPPDVRGVVPADAIDFAALDSLPPGPSTGAFSPDGTRLAVLGGSGLYVLDRDGELRRLTEPGASVSAFAWMPDGERIVVGEGPSSPGSLTLLNVDDRGGFTAPLDTPWSLDAHAGMAVSSDGRTIALVATERAAVGGERSTDIVLVELLTGTSRRLADPGDEHSPHFAGDDDVAVFGEDGATVVVGADGGRRRLAGGRPVGVMLAGGYVAVVDGGSLDAVALVDGSSARLATIEPGVEVVHVHPGGGYGLVRRAVDTPDGRTTRLGLITLAPVRSTGDAGAGR